MEVTWFWKRMDAGASVLCTISWRWPPIGPFIAHYIIGEIFVAILLPRPSGSLNSMWKGKGITLVLTAESAHPLEQGWIRW
jgi:hypothetical protein